MPSPDDTEQPSVVILTPLKNAAPHLDRYVELIERLDWPRDRLSIGLLEGDSSDDTYAKAEALLPRLEQRCHRARLLKRDFGFQLPAGVPRWTPGFQLARRSVLAKARNHLLFGALASEQWVLWIDVDVVDYPADIIAQLLATQFDIVVPHCVTVKGEATFDQNNWSEHGTVRMSDRRGTGAMRLDSVGGAMLLVKADLHRDGLIFPPFRYGVENSHIRPAHPVWKKGEVETEGLGIMAGEMGVQCWGLPDLEILHSST